MIRITIHTVVTLILVGMLAVVVVVLDSYPISILNGILGGVLVVQYVKAVESLWPR